MDIDARMAEISEDVFSWTKMYKGSPHGYWYEKGHWHADVEFPDIRHASAYAHIVNLPFDPEYPPDSGIGVISARLRDPVTELHKPVVLHLSTPLERQS